MFSLIISIIGIALVVALAGASIYYGGAAFSEGGGKAKAATYINQAQQIHAAITLATTDGVTVTTIADDLVPDYLAAEPKSPNASGSYTIGSTAITAVVSGDDICTKIQAQADASGAGYSCAGDSGTPEVFTFSYPL